jgi:hypothetical protein
MYSSLTARLRRARPPVIPPLLLAGLGLLLMLGLATPPDPRAIAARMPPVGQGDQKLFRAVAVRIAHGEAYYPTMRDELVARGYPTGSVVNWRTPMYLQLVARVPVALRGLLLVVAVLVLTGTALALRTVSTGACVAGLLLQNGVVTALWMGDLLIMPEPLAGGLIALSVLVSLLGWSGTSVLLGTAALFVRELTLPFVGIRLVWALWNREWREAIGWSLGLGAYALYLLWHIGQVHHAMPPHPTWHTMSYFQFGGLRFVLATLRANLWFDALPWWVTPFALVAALLGTWSAPPVVSLPILGYLAAFALAGQPFNWYWGWVPGMLLPLSWGNIGAARLHHRRDRHPGKGLKGTKVARPSLEAD